VIEKAGTAHSSAPISSSVYARQTSTVS
jgi:hypothetical protein